MTGEAGEGWRSDPYRRHELRYWDGQVWTPYVCDMGVFGDDPVFPVPDNDAQAYLAPRRMRRRRPLLPGLDRAAAWAIGGFLGVIALALASATDGSTSPSPPPPVAEVEVAVAQVPPNPAHGVDLGARVTAPNRAVDALDTLPVRPTVDLPADPAVLAEPWVDADGDGCDVRQDVLRRDLDDLPDDVVLGTGKCTVRAAQFHVVRVIPPAAAWRSGAHRLSVTQRRALANDPLNLITVSADAVRDRGTSDAAGWLPADRTRRCAYVARQVAVKTAYRLSISAAERRAMRTVLSTCPAQRLPDPARAEAPLSNPLPATPLTAKQGAQR